MKTEKLQQTTQKYKQSWDYYGQLYANKMNNLEEMNTLLEKYKLPTLNRKKLKIWTDQLQAWELELQSKSSKNQKPRSRSLHRWFLPQIKVEITSIFLKLLQKNCRGWTTLKLILQGHHHPDTKSRQKCYKKKKTTCQYCWWT